MRRRRLVGSTAQGLKEAKRKVATSMWANCNRWLVFAELITQSREQPARLLVNDLPSP